MTYATFLLLVREIINESQWLTPSYPLKVYLLK